MRIEVLGRPLPRPLRVAMDVVVHRQVRGRVFPQRAAAAFHHPGQFPQRQGAGLAPDDAGELEDESPEPATSPSSRLSSSGLSSFALAACRALA
jgi:hypothetical protein